MGVIYTEANQQPSTGISGSLDNLTIITAANAILNSTALRDPVIIPKIAVSVPATSSSTDIFTVATVQLTAPYGARLSSVSFAVDAVFQTNFDWQINISSVTSPGVEFQEFDPTVNTFDVVPRSKNFILKPGANITVNAYNRNSSNSTDGIMSVYIVYDPLTKAEAAMLKKFDAIIQKMADTSNGVL